MTNAEIGALHEFGNPSTGLPERSWLRSTLRDPDVQAQLEQIEAKLLAEVVAGRMSRDQALGLIGAWIASQIQKTITRGDVTPPLAPATVAAKGSSTPLVDTGQLVAAIGWEIVK